MAIAVRGHGAWWSTADEDTCHRLAVSTRRDVSIARVVQSFEGQHGDPERFARVLRSLGNIQPLLMDSQAKHVTVAAGVSDLLMRFPPDAGFHDAVWDQAAGSLLIEEAGGRVTDLAGQPLDFTGGRRLLRTRACSPRTVCCTGRRSTRSCGRSERPLGPGRFLVYEDRGLSTIHPDESQPQSTHRSERR